MYFPYLRGKQFELEALLAVSSTVYRNTIPIVEPISSSGSRLYSTLYAKLTSQSIPLLLITNPYFPTSGALSSSSVQTIIDTEMAAHRLLTLGFIIDQRFTLTALNSFLSANPNRDKALIFRFSPIQTELAAIQTALVGHPIQYMVFDERRSNMTVRSTFAAHPRKILLTDGFQRQDRNADYPSASMFESRYLTRTSDGWYGIGDYLIIGDFFKDGGGQGYVVTIHITAETTAGLLVYHFSSSLHSTTRGLTPLKFAEANNLLISSPQVIPLTSNGLDLFRDWHTRSHNPSLGAAKKASIMHHIELMSAIV